MSRLPQCLSLMAAWALRRLARFVSVTLAPIMAINGGDELDSQIDVRKRGSHPGDGGLRFRHDIRLHKAQLSERAIHPRSGHQRLRCHNGL
jgi:hypothetical protein